MHPYSEEYYADFNRIYSKSALDLSLRFSLTVRNSKLYK